MLDLCFVLMPYAGVEHPSIAIGLLKALLNQSNINSKAVYANLKFAEKIGLARYLSMDVTRQGYLLGEWTFSECAFPNFFPNHNEYFKILGLEPQKQEIIWEIRHHAKTFIEQIAQEVVELKPKIVSCSSTFQQHCPSLALLKKIRELNPSIITLMGGANCEGIMGVTTHREFPWVDFVISGEGDDLFTETCNLILTYGRDVELTKLPYGVLSPTNRNKNQTTCIPPRATAQNLDKIPFPDYDDYFEALSASAIAPLVRPGLLIETSRGCWWGQKSQCTFCGLNGNGMSYRAKSSQRVVEEFFFLSKRYKIRQFEVVDNILAIEHLNEVLPVLAKQNEPYEIFYETKVNLSREQVQQLAKAGVRWIQPGIESLHDSILKLMKKGTTTAINVQLLKWAREFGIRLSWNILFDFPGESNEWYLEMGQWLPLIIHLQPPSGLVQVQYHRFSPYHEHPEDFGIKISPFRTYFYVYPLPQKTIADLAYFFEESINPNDTSSPSTEKIQIPEIKGVIDFVAHWNITFWSSLPPLLCMSEKGNRLQIVDTRPCAVQRVIYLEGLAKIIYLLCDKALTAKELIKGLSTNYKLNLSWVEVEPVINELQTLKILLKLSNRFLSLAVKGRIPRLLKDSEFLGGNADITSDPEAFLVYSKFLDKNL